MPESASFTSMKRRFSYGLLYAVIITAFCTVSFSQASDATTCELSGTVFDQSDALVPNVEILFVNGTSYFSTRSDGEGQFRINLNPSRYEVLLRLPFDFWIYERSKIKVDCKGLLTINLYAPPMCVSFGCDPMGYSFDRFKRKDLPDAPEMVIAYNERKTRGGERTYIEGFLTYGPTTVHAREIVVDPTRKKVLALNGWIEDGKSRSNFENQTIQFATEFLGGTIETESISDRENRKRLKKLNETLKLDGRQQD
jgi:hypothetical protein